jgi:hypothetical protein
VILMPGIFSPSMASCLPISWIFGYDCVVAI